MFTIAKVFHKLYNSGTIANFKKKKKQFGLTVPNLQL